MAHNWITGRPAMDALKQALGLKDVPIKRACVVFDGDHVPVVFFEAYASAEAVRAATQRLQEGPGPVSLTHVEGLAVDEKGRPYVRAEEHQATLERLQGLRSEVYRILTQGEPDGKLRGLLREALERSEAGGG